MSRLNTKTCIVTAAGRGIGAAIARVFAREGATIVVTDKDEGSTADVAHEIGGHHLRLDVTSEANLAALTEVWPACDVLVNNAGITGIEEAMRRFGTVEEVASIALLLVSDEAAYMTGTELTVDGRLLAGSAAAPKADRTRTRSPDAMPEGPKS